MALSQSSREATRQIGRLHLFFLRSNAMEALLYIGEPAVPPLIKALKNVDHDVRRCAAELLGKIGDERAISPLCETLKDPEHEEIRTAAAFALAQIGEPAVLPLLMTLKEPDIYARFGAASALGQIGTSTIPGLLEVSKESDGSIRAAAATALRVIGGSSVVPALLEAIKDNYFYVRDIAAQGLGEIADVRAILPLCNALKDEYADVRRHAALALGMIGTSDVILPLCQALRDRSYVVRLAAGVALRRLGTPQTLAFKVLSSQILAPEEKLNALEALQTYSMRLGQTRPRGQKTLPSIPEYCRDLIENPSDPAAQEGARTVLAEIRKRYEQESYLRASSRQIPSHELLRAAAGEGDSGDSENLMRASQAPNSHTKLP